MLKYNPIRAGDCRSLEGLEMAFYCTAKPCGGGGRSNLVGIIPYIYWTQKTLSVYLAPWGKKMGVWLLYNIPDFEGNFDQYFKHNSKTILDMKLIFFHFVGIFIFYKMKKKFSSIAVFFMEIYSVFFIENGKF